MGESIVVVVHAGDEQEDRRTSIHRGSYYGSVTALESLLSSKIKELHWTKYCTIEDLGDNTCRSLTDPLHFIGRDENNFEWSEYGRLELHCLNECALAITTKTGNKQLNRILEWIFGEEFAKKPLVKFISIIGNSSMLKKELYGVVVTCKREWSLAVFV